uniref:Putative transcription factor WRKY n=1 Tax=Oryza meyeriana var. granulata TaxID=110450 RepID=A0A1V1H6S8_9ORYZ|nr:putative transcription factor WRKY [Oryza meyeriana var. granulata]
MQDGAGGGGDIHLLLSILADGEEQARQLGEHSAAHDDGRPSAYTGGGRGEEYYRGVARQLQCTFGRAMAVARAIEAAGAGASGSRGTTNTGDRSDSPRSADESSGRTARDVVAQRERHHDMIKRRKGLPRWTEKIRVPDASLEATPDDGLSWRKYGQKDILGAKFPRGYYRCTYRNAQGCPATKQVQRSDADLAVFDVTYQGAHTCHQKQRHASTAGDQPPRQTDASVELLMSFKNDLKVETDGLAPPSTTTTFHDQHFCFPSVPFPAGVGPPDDASLGGGGGFSSPFVSPAGSAAGSSYFSMEHCYEPSRGGQFVMSRGDSSELHEVVSAATATSSTVDPAAAVTNAGGFDYPLYLHHGELADPHLPFPPLFGPAYMYGQYRDA